MRVAGDPADVLRMVDRAYVAGCPSGRCDALVVSLCWDTRRGAGNGAGGVCVSCGCAMGEWAMNDTGLSDAGLVLACLCLAPAAHAGLALMQHGLGRSRSGAHTMLATLCAIAVAALVFVIVGSHWAGWPGDASHVVRLGGKIFNYLGVRGPGSGLGQPGSTMRGLTLVFEAYAAALTAMIPISAAADRWRLAAICASTALLAGFVLPLYMHAVWGGGWIASLLHVTDAGGGVVQCVGGLAATVGGLDYWPTYRQVYGRAAECNSGP
jgi:ammonia channel protein AmtB